MSHPISPVGGGLFLASLYARSGNKQNTILGSATAPPPPLDDEIRRLISLHGWEAVAKSAKKLAKPNKRAEPEKEDFRALGPILKEEARRLLNGEPARTRTELAELAAPAVKRKQSQSSVITRLLRRLGTEKGLWFRAIIMIDIAKDEFRCRHLIDACRKAKTIKDAEPIASFYLDQMNDAVNAIEAVGDKIPSDPTFNELLQAAAKARMKRMPPPDLSLLLGSHWKPTDAN